MQHIDGSTLRQTDPHADRTGLPAPVSSPIQPGAQRKLWTPHDYRAYLAVGERTFLEMEAKGQLAAARMFGPRLKRYIPEECEARAFAMPQEKAPEPAQLANARRARIDRMKAGGTTQAGA